MQISFFEHSKANLKLAIPIMIGQAGHMFASVADNIMVGHINSLSLAASALANSVFILFFVLALGISNGITPLVGTAFGEKDYGKIKILFVNGMFTNIIAGVLTAILMISTSPILNLLNQPKEVVELAIPFYNVFALSIIPYMIFMNFKQFSDGINSTKEGMIVSVLCNSLNVVLNFLLIYGNFGFPKLGLMGAAYSTLISRTLMPILFYIIFKYSSVYKNYRKDIHFNQIKLYFVKKIISLGFPIGLQFLLEAGAFIIGAIMVGTIGADEMAAHQIAINLATLTYLMANGIGSAATIRISNLIGERKYKIARRSGFVSFLLVILFMGTMGILFLLFNHKLPFIYVNELKVAGIASKLLIITAIFQLMDGIQVTGFSALRGLEDVKIPTIMSFISYWLVTVSVGYILAFHYGFGIYGIWYGYLIGLFVAAIMAFSRYNILTKKLIEI